MGGLASTAPWSTCTGGTKLPRRLTPHDCTGSCSLKHQTPRAKSCGPSTGPSAGCLRRLKRRLPPWGNTELPLMALRSPLTPGPPSADLPGASTSRCPKGMGTCGMKKNTVPTPGPRQRRGPGLSPPHALPNPICTGCARRDIGGDTNPVGMATGKPAQTSTGSLRVQNRKIPLVKTGETTSIPSTSRDVRDVAGALPRPGAGVGVGGVGLRLALHRPGCPSPLPWCLWFSSTRTL